MEGEQAEAENAATATRRLGRREWAVLLLVLLLGAGLRIYHIGARPAQFDEPLSLELTRGRGYEHERLKNGILWPRDEAPDVLSLKGSASLVGVWKEQHYDAHPPLFFLVLRVWREVFGEGIVAARSLSVSCGLAAILLVYLAVRTEYGAGVAGWAGLMLALAPAQVSVAQDARPYTMGMMFVCLAWYGAVRGSARIVFAGALGAAFTHYSCAFPLAVVAARWPRHWRAYVWAAAVFGAVWGPYVPEQMWQMSRTKDLTFIAYPLRRIIPAILATPGRWFTSAANPIMGVLLPLVCVRRGTRWLLAAVAAAVLPVAVWDLRAGSMTIEAVRYTVMGAPFLAALVAARRVWLIPAAVCLFSLLTMPTAYEGRSPAFRRLAEYADARSDANTAIIFAVTPELGPDNSAGHFYTFTCGSVKHAGWVMITAAPVVPDRLTGIDTVWVVSGWGGRDAVGPIPGFEKVAGTNFPEGGGSAEKWVRAKPAPTRPSGA